ncbi:MAG: AraC family transcriptional regulator [Polyangiaceae bacterium]|nr:AraC family transcriptional regulator [Polyangiaceae bacterium]
MQSFEPLPIASPVQPSPIVGPHLVAVFPDERTTMVRVSGRVDDADAERLEEVITSAEKTGRGPQRVLFDFGRLRGTDPRDLDRILALYTDHRALLERLIEAAALVPPAGIYGAAAHGVSSFLGMREPWMLRPSDVEASLALGARLADLENALTPEALRAWRGVEDDANVGVVEALRELLRENVAEASVEWAARGLSLSKRTLQRALQLQGKTFREMVCEARVERAKHLLAETTLKLAAISLEVGLQKPQHLRKIFVGQVGMSPLEYRRAVVAKAEGEKAAAERPRQRAVTQSGFFPVAQECCG